MKSEFKNSAKWILTRWYYYAIVLLNVYIHTLDYNLSKIYFSQIIGILFGAFGIWFILFFLAILIGKSFVNSKNKKR